MPKIIKKRVAKKKPVQEDKVKSAALHTVDALKAKQKQLIVTVSVIAVVVAIIAGYSLYSSSLSNKAYAFETEAYNYYYSGTGDKELPAGERWKKAADLYRRSVEIKASPTALYYLGNCYYNLGDLDNAIKQYTAFENKFSRAKGILPLVQQKLAAAYFRTGRNDKALETLARLSVIENGIYRDSALVLEARYLEGIGQPEKALEKYREISAGFPASPWSAEAGAKLSAAEARQAAPVTEETAMKKDAPAAAPKQPEKPAEKPAAK